MMEIIKRKVCKETFTSRSNNNWGNIDGDFLYFNILLSNTFDDMGVNSINALAWIPGKKYYKGNVVIYDGITWELTVDSYVGEYDEKFEELAFDTTPPSHWVDTSKSITTNISSYTNSKLTSLRRKKRPIDENGKILTPNQKSDEDWMIFYMENLVMNVDGDIETYIKNGKRLTRMVNAVGDMIKQINVNSGDNTITFVYEIGMKLADETLTPIIGSGVEYTDIYTFSPNTYKFNGNYEDLSINNLGIFNTQYGKSTSTINIGFKNVNVKNILSEIKYEYETTMLSSSTYKEEFLMGITYKPTVEADIIIDRGINSAFEKHLKLGEIKTLQDMENYGNSSFFNIKSDS